VKYDNASDLLRAYSVDLACAQHLSEEEQQALMTAAAQQGRSSLDQETRNQLLEEYLHLMKCLAMRWCPPEYRSLLPDIIGTVNLMLVEVATTFDPREAREGHLRAYLCSCIRGAVSEAIHHRRVIAVPRTAVQKALDQGQHEQLNDWTAGSLEEHMERLKKEDVEPMMVPLLPTEASPEADPAQRAQIDEWLSHLSPRDEYIVRLHYGLTEGDERAYPLAEIAELVDVTKKGVGSVLTQSHFRLKKVAEGATAFREQNGRQVVRGSTPREKKLPVLTAEQQDRGVQALQELTAQGVPITVRAVSKASGLPYLHTRSFLAQQRQDVPPEMLPWTEEGRAKHKQDRTKRIQRVYEQFLAEGRPLTQKYLAQAAQVDSSIIRDFLQARKHDENASGRM
jgi:RNA polymerase sigma factor (sigma-70 family)